MERIQELLAQIGLEPERVRMENMSAAMAGKFVEVAKEMKEQIAAMGHNPLREADQRSSESADQQKANEQSGKAAIP